MKKLLILILLISTNVFGGMTVTEYQQIKNSDGVGWYVVGLGNAFDFSNTKLNSLKEKQFYCLPEKKRLSERELLGMIDTWISEQEMVNILNIQIEPLLLSQLIQKYPCN